MKLATTEVVILAAAAFVAYMVVKQKSTVRPVGSARPAAAFGFGAGSVFNEGLTWQGLTGNNGFF